MHKEKNELSPAQKFLAEKVLPEIVGLPPEKWSNKFREKLRDVSADDRRPIMDEARKILTERGKIIKGLEKSVREVRDLEFEGKKIGENFKGILLIGGITGISYGKLHTKTALDPKKIRDIDFFPVVSGVDEISRFNTNLQEQLLPRIKKNTGYDPECIINIRIAPGLPERTADIMKDKRIWDLENFSHFDPEAWHFIGDPETKKLIGESMEIARKKYPMVFKKK